MGHQHPKDALKLDKYPPPILPPYSLMKAWCYYKQNRPYNDWGVIAAISYSPKTAQQIANRMMTNDDIKNRIAELHSAQKWAELIPVHHWWLIGVSILKRSKVFTV